jgi:hypothetical protein
MPNLLNEDRVQLFASLLKVLANPGVVAIMIENGEEVDYVQVVRSIADIVPYPPTSPIKDPGLYPSYYTGPNASYPPEGNIPYHWGHVRAVDGVTSADGGLCTTS